MGDRLHKSVIHLADGREFVFYDEQPRDRGSVTDPRTLPAISSRAEIRHDPLMYEWVVVAAHRQDRTHLPPADECPLCPSTPTRHSEIPAADYDVVVFENRFPSLAAGVPEVGPLIPTVERRRGVGRCEVVCFTSEHRGSLGTLPHRRLRTVVDVWADRTAAVGALPEVEYVFPFENRGEEIGVTLAHPHGQIYGYPFVPPRPARKLASARRYAAGGGDCLFCALREAEEHAKERVVARAEGWVAFVPAFARWPFEVHLYPTRHVPDLPALTDAERDGLASLLGDVLPRLDGLFDLPLPYMLTWQQAPVRTGRELFHAHAELFSTRRSATKLKFLASSESAAGVFINDIAPERAAELLRHALD